MDTIFILGQDYDIVKLLQLLHTIKLDEHLVINWGLLCNRCVQTLMLILLTLGHTSTLLNA